MAIYNEDFRFVNCRILTRLSTIASYEYTIFLFDYRVRVSPISAGVVALFLRGLLVTTSNAGRWRVTIDGTINGEFLIELISYPLQEYFRVRFGLVFLSIVKNCFVESVISEA